MRPPRGIGLRNLVRSRVQEPPNRTDKAQKDYGAAFSVPWDIHCCGVVQTRAEAVLVRANLGFKRAMTINEAGAVLLSAFLGEGQEKSGTQPLSCSAYRGITPRDRLPGWSHEFDDYI